MFIGYRSQRAATRRSSPAIINVVLGCVAFGCVVCMVDPAFAQPRVRSITAARVGDSRRIEVRADGLGATPGIRLYGRGEALPATASGSDGTFQAILPAGEPNGRALAFVAGESGLAGPFPLTIDDFPVMDYVEAEKSDRALTPPIAVAGTLAGDAVHAIRVQAKAGSTLALEIEARRFGAKFAPLLRVLSDRGTQLAWSQGTPALDGDARLEFQVHADGEYRVELHDALYRGAMPGNYRLKIGDAAGAPRTYPELPFGERLPQAIEPQSAAKFGRDVPGETSVSTAPLGINGVLLAPGEEDRWKIDVEGGKTYRIELIAARTGSPIDGVLTIYDAAGEKTLATADDQAKSADGLIEFAVPKETKTVTIGVKDLLGRGGPESIYHIAVTDAKAPAVEVIWPEEPVYLTAGGRMVLRGTLARKNYTGPVRVEIRGAYADRKIGMSDADALEEVAKSFAGHNDPHVSSQSISIAENVDEFLFEVNDGRDAPGAYRLRARVETLDGKTVLGYGDRVESTAARFLPDYRLGLFVVRGDRPALLNITRVESPQVLPLGLKTTLKLQATRAEVSAGKPARGSVRFSLLTDQPTPKNSEKEGKKNAKKEAQADDPERMIRLVGPALGADGSGTELELLIPGDLPRAEYRIAIKGELLADDGKTVVATAWTPIETWKTERPLAIEWENPPQAGKPAEVRVGAGETYTARGRIVRSAGFADSVRVTVQGWPDESPAPSIDVPADRTEFALPLRWPTALGKLKPKALELYAHALPSPGPAPVGGVRSLSLPLPIKLVPGEKPELLQTTILFDEAPGILARLKEKNPGLKLELDDKNVARGKAALALNSDQRMSAEWPGVALQVRENPGPGEIRYIRFAWSRQGGSGVGLQIGHDGRFGPDRPGEPSFRYRAGPGNTLGASLTVDPKHTNKQYSVATRDLYADFGRFTFTGLGFVHGDTQVTYYDQLIVGATLDDLEQSPLEYGAEAAGASPEK